MFVVEFIFSLALLNPSKIHENIHIHIITTAFFRKLPRTNNN
jgi:hypothetical protein